MTTDELNYIQAGTAIAQAVSAVFALGAAVAVPYIQRAIESKIRVNIRAGMQWLVADFGPTGTSVHFSPDQANYQEYVDRYGKKCMPCIEITNHATFPITITNVGVLQNKKSLRRNVFSGCVVGGALGELPCTVPPMSSQRIAFTDAIFDYSFSEKTLAYATTANGKLIYASASLWSFLAKKQRPNSSS
ncbi:hypothetical protein ACQW08_06270 [Gluconobacter japonicus]|uniref:hypothetical protein n=1 Tax=Gluconobacter japonicus TaxID=376620 RepID=UPI003D2D0F00